MTTLRATSVFGVLSAFLLALGGCGGASKDEAIRFNDAMVDADKRFVASAKDFLDAAAAAVNGGVMELTLVKRAYEACVEAAERMRADAKTLKVPKGKTSQAFYDAYLAVVAQREELVKEDFRIIMKVLEDPALMPQERARKLMPSARYLNNLDHSADRQVKIAQVAFASEFGFQLKK